MSGYPKNDGPFKKVSPFKDGHFSGIHLWNFRKKSPRISSWLLNHPFDKGMYVQNWKHKNVFLTPSPQKSKAPRSAKLRGPANDYGKYLSPKIENSLHLTIPIFFSNSAFHCIQMAKHLEKQYTSWRCVSWKFASFKCISPKGMHETSSPSFSGVKLPQNLWDYHLLLTSHRKRLSYNSSLPIWLGNHG